MKRRRGTEMENGGGWEQKRPIAGTSGLPQF